MVRHTSLCLLSWTIQPYPIHRRWWRWVIPRVQEGSLDQPLLLLWTLPGFPVLDNSVYRRQEGGQAWRRAAVLHGWWCSSRLGAAVAGKAPKIWWLLQVGPTTGKQGTLQVLWGWWPLQDLCRVPSLELTLGAPQYTEILWAAAFWGVLGIPSVTLRSKTIPGQVYQAFLLLPPWGNRITICIPLWYVSTKHPACTWHALSTILYTAYWHMTAVAGPQRFSWFLLFIPDFHWHKRNSSLLGSFLQSD